MTTVTRPAPSIPTRPAGEEPRPRATAASAALPTGPGPDVTEARPSRWWERALGAVAMPGVLPW